MPAVDQSLLTGREGKGRFFAPELANRLALAGAARQIIPPDNLWS